jgi:acylphosphatase
MKSVEILVSGKVQDVWYRKFTCDKARELKVRGTVQNLATGQVLIYASGSETQIKQLQEWCWTGSPQSSVSGVEVKEVELRPFSNFNIID